jgi:phage-related protein
MDPDAIVVIEVFAKKSAKTPKRIIENSKRRLKQYDAITNEG